jgi:transglutaminase-like putative cysteine protease
MRSVATVFFASVYGLTAIAGLMLAFAEGSPFPEILTPAFAIVAYVLTERLRKVHLPVAWANALGVVAFLYAGYQMFGTTIEMRLLAGAHLVVYLTWIVLFQEKRLPQYWWMCALSVLQVAIGSILTISSSYAGMLLGFMFASVWTLAVFSQYQAYLQYGESAEQAENAARIGLTSRLREGMWTGHRPGRNPVRTLLMQPSTARGTMQLDPDERWLGVRFALSMLAVSGGALLVAVGFFLFIPRLWAGRTEWGAGETKQFRTAAMTGFTTEVRLGDMVPLLENPKRVLQVNLFGPDGAPLDLAAYCERLGDSEPLFRGATLEMYEKGTWTGMGRGPSTAPVFAAPVRNCVRQQILMEPLGTPMLFVIEPAQAICLPNPNEQAEMQPITRQFFRPENVPSEKALSYDVYSPATTDIRRRRNRYDPTDPFALDYFRQYRTLPKSIPALVTLARKLTSFAPQRPEGTRDKAALSQRYVEILTRRLRDSGEYRYSLDTSSRDPNIDPVEDFVINRKAGHCEYFASALALMLRAVGVPTRLVSGFKGGTVNALSGTYEVEQRHAHVWVEAFIEGRDGRGYWMTVDPTPAARDASVEGFASRIRTAHELASVVSSTWSRLISIDIEAQETAFYVPLQSALRNWWTPASGRRPFIALLIAGIVDFATDPTQWFTAMGLVVATCFGIVLTGIVLLVRIRRRLWQRLRGLWKPRGSDRRIRIAFYERFENVCRQLGLVRSRSQTQREFAGTVGSRIRQVVQSADGLPELPPRLVEFFYRVRFGEEDLSPPVIDALNRDLTALEHALRKPRRH